MRPVLLLVFQLGCEASLWFTCEQSTQCMDRGTIGICEPNGSCSFDDTGCPSGRRFDVVGPPEVAGRCGGSMVLAPVADAHVDQSQPTTNFGTGPAMKADGNGTGNKLKRAFVAFDTSTMPIDAEIAVATLQLCIVAFGGMPPNAPGHTHDLVAVTAPWSEAQITWATQPEVASNATASLVVPDAAGCLTFDVTPDVRGGSEGVGFGWSVRDRDERSTGSSLDYGTRERGDGRPALVVTYTSAD